VKRANVDASDNVDNEVECMMEVLEMQTSRRRVEEEG